MTRAIQLLKEWGGAAGQEPAFAEECLKAAKMLEVAEVVPPFCPVTFENGIQATLLGDGSVQVMTSGRGQRCLSIEPKSDNSVQIRPDRPPILTRPRL